VLINGDLVGRGRTIDYNLARRLIQEELDGRVPWRYLPGDDELSSGNLSHFRSEFGKPVHTFDQEGTRFVLLNSALGTFRLGGFRQLVQLRSTLAAAAGDPSVSSVIVVAHHPSSDPDPTGAAELADPREGDLVESLLADFRADSGKEAGYVGSHARRFALVRHDGVPLATVGPVDGPARGTAGSFEGWSMLRIDTSTPSWLQAEFRPTVDTLRINAPARIDVGATRGVSATLTQGAHRVPVRYPMSAQWVSTATVHVGPADSAPRRALAAYDPSTGQLTALRAGDAELELRVNGTTATRTVTVR
jgi:hypothetical protein